MAPQRPEDGFVRMPVQIIRSDKECLINVLGFAEMAA
jgi:hypothetical protein